MRTIQEILLRDRFRAYKSTFLGDDGKLHASSERIIADLKKFCRADRSTHIPGDPYSTANLEGRREVFLRICSFLNLSEQDFYPLKEEIENDGTGTRYANSPDIGEYD